MAFNKLGYITMTAAAPGPRNIHYWFGGPPGADAGDDHGAQYAMADPEPFPGILWVTRQGKERVFIPTSSGTSGFKFVRYWVTVIYTPVGGSTTIDFTLQGGGNT